MNSSLASLQMQGIFCVHKQSHVAVQSFACLHRQKIAETYGEQHDRGIEDSAGGVCISRQETEPCAIVQKTNKN